MNSVVGFGGEVIAWSAQAEKKPGDAAALLRSAADDEGGIEKTPSDSGTDCATFEGLTKQYLRIAEGDRSANRTLS